MVEAGKRIWLVRSISFGDFSSAKEQQNRLDSFNSIAVESHNLANPSISLKLHQNPPAPVPATSIVPNAAGDLPAASWWDGDCDSNRYLNLTGSSSYRLGATFRGLVACGPGGVGSGTYKYGILTSFGASGGIQQYEFQCAELPKRYLYLLYGIAPKTGNGADVVNVYANARSNLQKVTNGTPNSGLAAGDIISYDGPAPYGHTAIITAVTVDSNGNGTYTIIEQNAAATGTRTGTISNWWLNSSAGISAYIHDSTSNTTTLPADALKCADEGGVCSFSGTASVYYGANNQYYFKDNISGSINCNNDIFGDPISGAAKACYYVLPAPPPSCPTVTGEVKLYDGINCTGSVKTAVGTGLFNLVTTFNDLAEAVAIPSGWSARLFQNNKEILNESACFGSTDADLNDNTFANGGKVGNNTTWMRVYDIANCGVPTAPGAPMLLSPGNASSNPSNYDLNFTWNSVADATEYQIEWWGGPYSAMQPCGWSSATNCQVGVVFAGNTYSWHVKARNAVGESSWSETRTFTVLSDLTPPGTFSKTSPANASSGQSNSPTISWGIASNVANYAYCYDTINNNVCDTGWQSIGTATSASLSGLGSGTNYFWRVRASNPSGDTYANNDTWWTFSTQPATPAGDSYEPDDSFDLASTIAYGSPQAHSILPATDLDYVKFTLTSISEITLETSGNLNSDTRMWLYDSNQTLIEFNDDNGINTYSQIDRLCGENPLPAGTYYVKVDEFENNAEIALYSLAFNITQDCEHTTIFADVSFSYWARPWIENLYQSGITNGCSLSPLTYCPEAVVTRGQMAVFLLRGKLGSIFTPPTPTGSFLDVPPDYWSAGWIEHLASLGITNGCGTDSYCPEDYVTRAQMAVFLIRSKYGSGYTPPPATGKFTDVPESYWAATWIENLASDGITSGCGPTTYCPEEPVTRAQMAVFLVRSFLTTP